MAKSYISLKYEELKQKFNGFWIHRKKVKALENYASVSEFEGSKYIRMLKELLADGFLDQEEERFLEHQIKKAEIDVFSWCHRTRWLKEEMGRMSAAKRRKVSPQIYMEFPEGFPVKIPEMNFPVAAYLPSSTQQVARL